MPDERIEETPQSPEVQREYVRDELDQEDITHRGDKREAPEPSETPEDTSGASKHMGAVDDEVVPVVPPMAGPADLIGEENENAQGNEDGKPGKDDELFDPYDHITPG